MSGSQVTLLADNGGSPVRNVRFDGETLGVMLSGRPRLDEAVRIDFDHVHGETLGRVRLVARVASARHHEHGTIAVLRPRMLHSIFGRTFLESFVAAWFRGEKIEQGEVHERDNGVFYRFAQAVMAPPASGPDVGLQAATRSGRSFDAAIKCLWRTGPGSARGVIYQVAFSGFRIKVMSEEACPGLHDRAYLVVPVYDQGKARRVHLVAEVVTASPRDGAPGGSFTARVVRIEDGVGGKLWKRRVKALGQGQASGRKEVAA